MKRTKEEALITKENIMNKGLALFVKNGFNPTTMDDILSVLKLTKGAFYGHFINKEDLLKQILEREFRFISEMVTIEFISRKSEKQMFQDLLYKVINNFYGNKRFRNVIELTWFKLGIDVCTKIMEDKTTFNEYFILEVHSILNRAQKNKLLQPRVHPYNAALQITAMINGIYRLYFVTHEQFRHKETAINMMDAFVDSTFL